MTVMTAEGHLFWRNSKSWVIPSVSSQEVDGWTMTHPALPLLKENMILLLRITSIGFRPETSGGQAVKLTVGF